MKPLLRHSAWRSWAAASFLARLPTSMALLSFQLAGVYAIGSIAAGAELAGITSFTAGLIGPARGAWLDGREMRHGLQLSCCAAAGAMGAFAFAVALRGPFWLLVGLAVGLGVAIGGVWGGFRALLLHAVPGSLLRRAHFVESLSTEVGYGIGPLLVTGVAAVAGVIPALALMTVVFIAAAVVLRRVPQLPPSPRGTRERRAALTRPIVVICAIGALQSVGFGMVESNVPARMTQYGHSPDAAGIFLALLSIGSILGGLVVSIVPIATKKPALVGALMFLAFAGLVAPSVFASSAWQYGAFLVFAPLMLVPLSGLGAAEVEARLGEHGRGRVFALYFGAIQVGGGVGMVTNGVLQSVVSPHHVPLVAIALFTLIAAFLAGLSWHPQARHSVAVAMTDPPARQVHGGKEMPNVPSERDLV